MRLTSVVSGLYPLRQMRKTTTNVPAGRGSLHDIVRNFMGWNIDIRTDKPMDESLIEEIIAELPSEISNGFGKQSWGWSLAVDLRLRDPHEIGLSGSCGMSGHKAQFAAEAIARRLEKRGIECDVGEMSV